MIRRWDILVISVGQRAMFLERQVPRLLELAKPFDGQIGVRVYWDNFERTRHEARNLLLQQSTADYVCFVDDDDTLPDYYCERVMEALTQSPDYVGWRMQAWWDGEKLKPTFHSLRYRGWWDDADGYYRDVSHLNPVRRDLAAMIPFPAEASEDAKWSRLMGDSRLLQTEVFIDDPMYFYDFDTSRTLTNPENRADTGRAPRLRKNKLLTVTTVDG